MIERFVSLWVFFVGCLLAVLCYMAGYIHGSKLFSNTREMYRILKRIRVNMDRIQKRIEED